MSVGSPETAVLVARVRDDVSRRSAELAARIPAHVPAASSVRVDGDLFVAAGNIGDGEASALGSPVVGIADAAVVPDVAMVEQIPVPHAGLHAAVYRSGELIREVITVECGVERATADGMAAALADAAVRADVWAAPGENAGATDAVSGSTGLLATAPLAVLAVPGFGVVVSATESDDAVTAAATAFQHFSSARPG